MSLESDTTTTTPTTTPTTSPTRPAAPTTTAATDLPTTPPGPPSPSEPSELSPSDPGPHPTFELRTVVVARGDSFWSIAERAVSERLGRPATDDEIARYWRLLIEVNRPLLVHAEHPDLIHAGQRFVLP